MFKTIVLTLVALAMLISPVAAEPEKLESKPSQPWIPPQVDVNQGITYGTIGGLCAAGPLGAVAGAVLGGVTYAAWNWWNTPAMPPKP